MPELTYRYVSEELQRLTIQRRREFHRYPELGWTEYRTSARVAQVLERLGFQVKLGREVCSEAGRMGVPPADVLAQCEDRAAREGTPPALLECMRGGYTGVIGILHGAKPGGVTALRFDLDALPIREQTEEAYASSHPGVMHACGHDGHTAAGLAAAQCLALHRQELSGEVRLIFQPAEEGCRGAGAIVQKGWLDDVDLFLAGHIGIGCRTLGQIQVCQSGFLATTKLNYLFSGKAAHAGNVPEQGNNALLAAAVFTTNVYAISRNSQGKTRINVGKFISGSGRNIIADRAYLEVETRGESSLLNRYMRESAARIAEGAARMYQVSCTEEVVGNADSASSDTSLAEALRPCAEEMNLAEGYSCGACFNASEDATAMMRSVQKHGGKAAYFLFGSELTAEHHQNTFNFNEQVLPLMAEFYVRAVLERKET